MPALTETEARAQWRALVQGVASMEERPLSSLSAAGAVSSSSPSSSAVGSHKDGFVPRLPSAYVPADYLPGGKLPEPALLEAVAALHPYLSAGKRNGTSSSNKNNHRDDEDGNADEGGSEDNNNNNNNDKKKKSAASDRVVDFERATALLFQERLPYAERLHTAPHVASFSSRPNDNVEFRFAFLNEQQEEEYQKQQQEQQRRRRRLLQQRRSGTAAAAAALGKHPREEASDDGDDDADLRRQEDEEEEEDFWGALQGHTAAAVGAEGFDFYETAATAAAKEDLAAQAQASKQQQRRRQKNHNNNTTTTSDNDKEADGAPVRLTSGFHATLVRQLLLSPSSGSAGASAASVDNSSSISGGKRRAVGLRPRLRPDFYPIILVTSAATAPLQLLNMRDFLESGRYVDPATYAIDDAHGGRPRYTLVKPESEIVSCRNYIGGGGGSDGVGFDLDGKSNNNGANTSSSSSSAAAAAAAAAVGSGKGTKKPETVLTNGGGGVAYGVRFRKFLLLDDPRKVGDWRHVCACVSSGREWELEAFYPPDSQLAALGLVATPNNNNTNNTNSGSHQRHRRLTSSSAAALSSSSSAAAAALLEARRTARTPTSLFSRTRGFVAYFEEDPVPPSVANWHVAPLVLTRRALREHQHSNAAAGFWQTLMQFLDNHPFFKDYTEAPEENSEFA